MKTPTRAVTAVEKKPSLPFQDLPLPKSREELTPQEISLEVKTWLERSRGFLEGNRFDEALQAAEQAFLFDPENLEASRLVDEIKLKAREEGAEESVFLQQLYQEEIEGRIRHYSEEADAWMKAGRWGAARMAVEKILFLDPDNFEGQRLLAVLEARKKSDAR